MEKIINNLEELKVFAGEFVNSIEQRETAVVVTLSGDIGSGKTTFTQMLGVYLGIIETITSPTFVIQKEYEVLNHSWIKRLIHIDAYRLENKSELEHLGWQEIVKRNDSLVVIEWPEMVSDISLPNLIELKISINENNSRSISVR